MKLKIINWAIVFTFIYIAPLLISAYAFHAIGLRPPSDLLFLVIATLATNFLFARKHKRTLSIPEYFWLLLLCVIVNQSFQMAMILIYVKHSIVIEKMPILILMLAAQAVLIAIGLLPTVVKKYVQSAA